MPSPAVRSATLDDVPAVIAVQDAVWRMTFTQWLPEESLIRTADESIDLWAARMARTEPGCGVYVVDLNGQVLGFAWTRAWTDTPDLPPQTVKLNALYVAPGSQSAGLGGQLMTTALDRAHRAGYHQAALWVIEQNERARGFYECHGWQADLGTRKTWRGVSEVRYLHSLEPTGP